jgi:hypothetical protein
MTKKEHGKFWFGDWSSPNPHDEDLHEAIHCARYNLENLTQIQMYRILQAAESYCHFAGHPGTTESIVKQLRELRTAVKNDKT